MSSEVRRETDPLRRRRLRAVNHPQCIDTREWSRSDVCRSADMDPLTQRMITRSHSLRRIKEDKPNLHRKRLRIYKEDNMYKTGKTLTNSQDLTLETNRVMDSFLQNALGNLHLLTSDDDDSDTTTIIEKACSSTNQPVRINEDQKENYPLYTISGYREMTYKRSRMRPPAPSITFYMKELKQLERERTLNTVETLQREIVAQKNILYQLTKALTYCCASEETRTSSQRVECEKLLLLSSHKYTATKNKIEQLKTDIRNGCVLQAEKGIVNVSNLSLEFNRVQPSEIDNGGSVWIMCVLSHEETVMATEAKLLNKDIQMIFKEEFTFKNLFNDFNINVQVYVLSLKRGKNMKHKQQFKKILPGISSCSLRRRCIRELIDSPILARQAIFKSPDFHLEGTFNIKLGNLKSSLTLDEFSLGQIQMSLKWDVESKVEMSGFLSMREEIGEQPVWDRRWCFLEACTLKFWNYPTDKEQMLPVRTLDLRQCVTPVIKWLDRSICSRPRTFLLEIAQVQKEDLKNNEILPEEKIVRKFLFSADTNHELRQWCMVLNKNVELLRKWATN